MTFIVTLLIVFISYITAKYIIQYSAYYDNLLNSKTMRNGSLDGIRGILSLGVFIYHSNITYYYYQTGEWSGSYSHFLSVLGKGSVSFFFIITGFLFWGMIINKNGLNDLKYFFTQRVKRLLPMFLFSLILIFSIAIFQSEYLLPEIVNNLYLKILYIFHINSSNISVTGIQNMSIINAGVFWTLVYEWKFYILLPIISFIFIKAFNSWKYFPLILLSMLVISPILNLWTLFVFGMLSASIKYQYKLNIKSLYLNICLLISIVILFILPNVNSLIWYFIAFVIFTIIFSTKNYNISTLELAPFRLLGVASYSIYLLHGIFLWIVFQLINTYKMGGVQSMTIEMYWAIILFISFLLVFVSSITFMQIENRFHHYWKKD